MIPSSFIPLVLAKHSLYFMAVVSEDSEENKFDFFAHMKVLILDTAHGPILLSSFFDTVEEWSIILTFKENAIDQKWVKLF